MMPSLLSIRQQPQSRFKSSGQTTGTEKMLKGRNENIVMLKGEARSGSVSRRTTENKVLLLYYYFWLRALLLLGRNNPKEIKYAPVLCRSRTAVGLTCCSPLRRLSHRQFMKLAGKSPFLLPKLMQHCQ